jgi:hypothetical protein
MQIIPRHRLPHLFRAAGLDPVSRDFPDVLEAHRLTVLEQDPLPFVSGPHRKRITSDGRVEGPFPIADRPALSGFIAAAFAAVGASSVLATVPEGALWLNNKAQAAYLWKVPDAQQVALFLRRRGLTDRFQGGFCIRKAHFADSLPRLAANTYAGGSNVLFAALDTPACRLTVLACHHFDLHFASPDPVLLETIAQLAPSHRLMAETLVLPDLSESTFGWPEALTPPRAAPIPSPTAWERGKI